MPVEYKVQSRINFLLLCFALTSNYLFPLPGHSVASYVALFHLEMYIILQLQRAFCVSSASGFVTVFKLQRCICSKHYSAKNLVETEQTITNNFLILYTKTISSHYLFHRHFNTKALCHVLLINFLQKIMQNKAH
jgi:hypothetical protein